MLMIPLGKRDHLQGRTNVGWTVSSHPQLNFFIQNVAAKFSRSVRSQLGSQLKFEEREKRAWLAAKFSMSELSKIHLQPFFWEEWEKCSQLNGELSLTANFLGANKASKIAKFFLEPAKQLRLMSYFCNYSEQNVLQLKNSDMTLEQFLEWLQQKCKILTYFALINTWIFFTLRAFRFHTLCTGRLEDTTS